MSAKAKVVPFPVPPAVEEDDEECPKCPPVGAPAWLATFADIATNLMAFFVLILGFAQFDEPSFKKMAGAMREHFGFRIIEGEPPAPTIIEMAPPTMKDSGESDDRTSGDGVESNNMASEVAEALKQALAQGQLEVDGATGTVTLKLPEAGGADAAMALAEAIASVAGAEVTEKGTEGEGGQAEGAGESATPSQTPAEGTADAGGAMPVDGEGGKDTAGQSGETAGADAGGDGAGRAEAVRAEMVSMQLQQVFSEQMAEGQIKVDQRDGKVMVTVGAGGAFQSGSADLSDEARDIMARISEVTDRPNRSIEVTGHTDDVPISGRYDDNFALAAARAASVVRELVENGAVDPSRISAVSRGEFDPVADNGTEEGRAKNRRIEIEIKYDE